MAAVAVLLTLISCTGRFELYNTNPNQVKDGDMAPNNYRTGTKVVAMQGLVVPVEEHMYQFNESLSGGPFAGYVGSTVDTWLTRFETFNPSADWRKWPFSQVITEMYAPYRGIVNSSDDDLANAFADIMRIAIMLRVTDSYGPIPYSDAVANESVNVAYDSQQDVYKKMFEELDNVIKVFTVNRANAPEAWSTYDKVYYGDIAKWQKFANSLKLRMAMRISYVDTEEAERLAAEAIEGGVILENADNAYMHPVENRLPLIYNEWSDHRAGADIICFMSGYKDPRIDQMFTRPKDGSEHKGIRLGCTVSKKSEFTEKYSSLNVKAEDPILWMNAAEVNFLLSEYYLRLAPDNAMARQHYEKGITLSFEEWKAEGAGEYIKSTLVPARHSDPINPDYSSAALSSCTVAWDDAADEETSLEKIITQKWIAVFPLGTEAWSEYRRTGYPKLFPAIENLGTDNVDLNHRARRLTYPAEEYSGSNVANLNKAIDMLSEENTVKGNGGDSMGTCVWWDVKPY